MNTAELVFTKLHAKVLISLRPAESTSTWRKDNLVDDNTFGFKPRRQPPIFAAPMS